MSKVSEASVQYTRTYKPPVAVVIPRKGEIDFHQTRRLSAALERSVKTVGGNLKFDSSRSGLKDFTDHFRIEHGARNPVLPRIKAAGSWRGVRLRVRNPNVQGLTDAVYKEGLKQLQKSFKSEGTHSLSGWPMSTMIAENGKLIRELMPIASCDDPNIAYALCEDGLPVYHSAKLLWRAHVLALCVMMFGAKDKIRENASLASTIVKYAFQAKDRNVRIIITDMSSPSALGMLPQDAIKDQRLLEMCWGRDKERMEIDGGGLCGRGVLPNGYGVKDPAQVRLTDVYSDEVVEFIQNMGDAIEHRICHERDLAKERLDAIYTECAQYANEYLEENNIQGTLDFCKGLVWCVDGALEDNVLLVDLNMLKGRNKGRVADHVDTFGFMEVPNGVVGILKSDNNGSTSAGWQPLLYALSELPADFPGDKAGQFGLSEAIDRFWQHYHKGMFQWHMGQPEELYNILKDSDTTPNTDDVSVKLMRALWADGMQRKRLAQKLGNAARGDKFGFQTVGMEMLGDRKPRCRYAYDCNDWISGAGFHSLTGIETDDSGCVEIVLHDGKKQKAPVILLGDQDFWASRANSKFALVVTFRHPVSNWDVVVPALCINPWAIPYGAGTLGDVVPHAIGIASATMKWVFVGDTDGDKLAYIPLHLSVLQDGGSYHLANYKPEDYGVLYTFSSVASVYGENRPASLNVEEYMGLVGKAPRGLGITPVVLEGGKVEGIDPESERLVGTKSKLIGCAALFQGLILRLMEADHKGLLSARNEKQLKWFRECIIQPMNHSLGALMELIISLEKKYSLPAIQKLVNEQILAPIAPALLKRYIPLTKDEQNKSDLFWLGQWVNRFCVCRDTISLYMINEDLMGELATAITRTMSKLGVRVAGEKLNFASGGSRPSDIIKTKNQPEGYHRKDDIFWGVFQESGFQDAIGQFNRRSNSHIATIKSQVDEWEFYVKGDLSRILQADRIHKSEHVAALVAHKPVSEEMLDKLAEMVRLDTLKQQLKVSLSRWTSQREKGIDHMGSTVDDLKASLEFGSFDSILDEWLVAVTLRLFAGDEYLGEDFITHMKHLQTEPPAKADKEDWCNRATSRWVNKFLALKDSNLCVWGLTQLAAEDELTSWLESLARKFFTGAFEGPLCDVLAMGIGTMSRRESVKLSRHLDGLARFKELREGTNETLKALADSIPDIEKANIYKLSRDKGLYHELLCKRVGVPMILDGSFHLFDMALEGIENLGFMPNSEKFGYPFYDASGDKDFIHALVRADKSEDAKHKQKDCIGRPVWVYRNVDTGKWSPLSAGEVEITENHALMLMDDQGVMAIIPANPMAASLCRAFDQINICNAAADPKGGNSRKEPMVDMRYKIMEQWEARAGEKGVKFVYANVQIQGINTRHAEWQEVLEESINPKAPEA